MSLNVVVLQGRLGQDPETRYTSGGKTVTNIGLAVDQGFGEEKTVSWINVTAWQKTAEFVTKYFKKGDAILVQGRLQARTYTDKNEQQKTVLEVVAEKVDFPGGRVKEMAATANGGESAIDPDCPF